jgi:hypothetical protein
MSVTHHRQNPLECSDIKCELHLKVHFTRQCMSPYFSLQFIPVSKEALNV